MDKFYNGKLLRRGYTTGTCAAAASKAALIMLLSKEVIETVQVTLPDSQVLLLDVLEVSRSENMCSCAIKKDGGDDPDATNNLLIFSTVSFSTSNGERRIIIDGGDGVGRITLKGLDQEVGFSAINSVPRKMINDSILEVLNTVEKETVLKKDVKIIISIPGGDEVAKCTFNPNLGIIGGLSILGTTGIVDPMSSRALVATFKSELSVYREKGISHFLLVLGNYGLDFAKYDLGVSTKPYLMCSNYLGDSIDSAIENSMENVLLVGHIGKLIKCAIGILNTHSRHGDGRIEAFIRAALVADAPLNCLKEIEKSATTDAVLQVLVNYKILEEILENIKKRVIATIEKRCSGFLNVEIICFTRVEFDRSYRKKGTSKRLDENNKVLFYSEGAEKLM